MDVLTTKFEWSPRASKNLTDLKTEYDRVFKTKKQLCFLVEILLRSTIDSFYSYDKIWLKYI